MWIGLINEEEGRLVACRHAIKQAEVKEVVILTSTFTLAEVFKKKCEGVNKGLAQAKDAMFEEFLEQDYVVYIQLDRDVGILARRILRSINALPDKTLKPQDAIHLASAALHNVDKFHTFNGSDLLSLDGLIDREDGEKLKICTPPQPDQGELGYGTRDQRTPGQDEQE